MGKRLISQNRGRGTPTYRSPRAGFTDIKYNKLLYDNIERTLIKVRTDPGRSSVIAIWQIENQKNVTTLAHMGAHVGLKINKELKIPGSVLQLKDIPAFVETFDIEIRTIDGGKVARAAGCYVHIIEHKDGKAFVKVKQKVLELDEKCYATIGIPAGGDKRLKPILKAGKAFHIAEPKARKYPYVSRIKMHHADHPFGGSGKRRVGRPRHSSRHAPPGAKVGSIAPKRTGYKK